MAADAAMFRRAEIGEGSLRIYSWSEPWVTLGRSQPAPVADELYPGLPWTRRPTGGGAVLHGRDATVSAALPLNVLRLARREVRAIYRTMVGPLASALARCGLECFLAEERAGTPDVDCFRSAGPLDLLSADGRKVAGCAMAIGRAAVLLQASIPLGEWRHDRLAEAYPAAWRAAGHAVSGPTWTGGDA